MSLFTRNDLFQLDRRLAELQHAPFFRAELKSYLAQVRSVAAEITSREGSIEPRVAEFLTNELWTATRYLSGSVSREIPYETVYGLEAALSDWIDATSPHVITTAFLPEKNYHFRGVSNDFYALAESELGVRFEQRLVQVALPGLYKHLPIHNSVLYHELGHFIDQHFGFTSLMALVKTPAGEQIPDDVLNHFQEHFADLFAACYVGDAIAEMLEALAPNQPASLSHPSTSDRVDVINDFLAGRSNWVVDFCRAALGKLSAPELSIRSTPVGLENEFGNLRPYRIATVAEVHGVFPAGLSFMKQMVEAPSGLWEHLSEPDIIRIANDLVEKSIRNWTVQESWNNGNPA